MSQELVGSSKPTDIQGSLTIKHNGGRLGNQLFAFATLISSAIDHQLEPCLYSQDEIGWYINRVFHRPFKINPNAAKFPVSETIGSEYSELNVTKNIALKGWFQTEKYFSHNSTEIRQRFKFKHEALLREKFAHFLANETVAIHIRRGDYVNSVNNRFPVMPIEYYNFGIKYFLTRNVKTFLFFSDDIKWCRQNFGENPLFNYISTGNEIEDLYLFSYCKHAIIANSSYSWWGSWLINNPQKIILAPSINLSFNLEDINNDYYPESYLQIHWDVNNNCQFRDKFDELTRCNVPVNWPKNRHLIPIIWPIFINNQILIREKKITGRYFNLDLLDEFFEKYPNNNYFMISEYPLPFEIYSKIPPRIKIYQRDFPIDYIELKSRILNDYSSKDDWSQKRTIDIIRNLAVTSVWELFPFNNFLPENIKQCCNYVRYFNYQPKEPVDMLYICNPTFKDINLVDLVDTYRPLLSRWLVISFNFETASYLEEFRHKYGNNRMLVLSSPSSPYLIIVVDFATTQNRNERQVQYPEQFYCINLNHRIDRWKKIEMEFKKNDLEVYRVNALSGTEFDHNPNNKTLGQIGCLKSHDWVVFDAWKNNYQSVVIFEDDITLNNNFQLSLKHTLRTINKTLSDWILVYLSGILWGEQMTAKNLVNPGDKIAIHDISGVSGAHAMLYHNHGYEYLANMYGNHYKNADDALQLLPPKSKFIIRPFLTSVTSDPISDVYPSAKEDFIVRKKLVDRYFSSS